MADPSALEVTYRSRAADAQLLADRLCDRIKEALQNVPHIDRISFRVKSWESFAAKAGIVAAGGANKYDDPLREIEDQIAGRVLVFFRDDLKPVITLLEAGLGTVESVHREPSGDAEFGYESDHFIFVIPSHLKPPSWIDDPLTPKTFELQVRTLFMHAWAEPQHDVGYKPGVQGSELSRDQRRELAWIAASAWGADQTLNNLARQLGVTSRSTN